MTKMMSIVFCSLLSINAAYANDYPERPIHLVVPYAAGGMTDVVTRLVAQELGNVLGQTIVVENRPGAATTVASNYIRNQKPDGYTLYAASLSLPLNQFLQKDVKYDAFKDYTILSGLVDSPMVLQVRSSLGVSTMGELVDSMKKSPGKYTIGASGVGASNHIGAENWLMKGNLDALIVQYQGGGPIRTAMMGNEVDMTFATVTDTQTLIASGHATAIAVATNNRIAAFPDVPTVNETMGWDDFEVVFWTALLAPAGLDEEVIQKIENAMALVSKNEELKARLVKLGAELNITSAQATEKRMQQAVTIFGPIIQNMMRKEN